MGVGPGTDHVKAIMATYEPSSGSIVHIELYSEDVEGFQSFAEAVFDWSFERDEALDYTMWRSGTPPFGALLDPADAPVEVPSALIYLAVDDVEGAGRSIVEAGGELLLDAMEIPGMGALSVFREPGGVIEAVWEDRPEGEAAEVETPLFTDEPAIGSVTHFELYSEDPEATQDFHESVFGWTFETIDDGAYTLAQPPTPPAGGLMAATDEMPVGPLLYLQVESADDVSEEIADAGGAVLREPFEIEGWGTMAVFGAPGGVTFAVWESAVDAADQAEPEVAP